MISILQGKKELENWLEDKRISFEDDDPNVKKILQEIRKDGDAAVRKYTEQFDGVKLKSFLLSDEEKEDALAQVSPEIMEGLQRAKANVFEYHLQQKPRSWSYQKDGKNLGQLVKPLDSAGLYVPGGKGMYPSSVLMTAIPAKIAGVENIVMISPPRKDGTLHPVVIAAAEICGVDAIYKIGGVQGVAALAYGTETIPKVDKVVGPGNKYVTLAKKYLYGTIDIDSLAGPSEVMILADETVPLEYLVTDLFAQAEHSEDAQSVVVVPSTELADNLAKAVEEGIKASQRKEILEQSVEDNSCIVVSPDLNESFDIINYYAPEHLQIMHQEADDALVLDQVRHAGAIFIGQNTPVALGDYFAGPNHTLPTNGTARYASPLGVYDFVKYISVLRYSQEQLHQDRKYAAPIAEIEGFFEHANSLTVRD